MQLPDCQQERLHIKKVRLKQHSQKSWTIPYPQKAESDIIRPQKSFLQDTDQESNYRLH